MKPNEAAPLKLATVKPIAMPTTAPIIADGITVFRFNHPSLPSLLLSISLSERLAQSRSDLLTLEPHPNIKYITVEQDLLPDGKVDTVVVIYTDLELSNLRPDYDDKAVSDLVGHIQNWQTHYKQRVKLKTAR